MTQLIKEKAWYKVGFHNTDIVALFYSEYSSFSFDLDFELTLDIEYIAFIMLILYVKIQEIFDPSNLQAKEFYKRQFYIYTSAATPRNAHLHVDNNNARAPLIMGDVSLGANDNGDDDLVIQE